MSDTTPPAQPEPTPPNTGYTAPPAANPYAPAGNAYAAAGAPAKAPVLSIISLIAGIVGLLGAWIAFIPIVGSILSLFIPAAAVILGVLGKKKEPQAAKGLWLTGIILGIVSLAIAVISLIFWIVVFATAGAQGAFDYSY
jgi:hypothetical protein